MFSTRRGEQLSGDSVVQALEDAIVDTGFLKAKDGSRRGSREDELIVRKMDKGRDALRLKCNIALSMGGMYHFTRSGTDAVADAVCPGPWYGLGHA